MGGVKLFTYPTIQSLASHIGQNADGQPAAQEDTAADEKLRKGSDRLKQQLPPACAQACPTASIKFGPLTELRKQAHDRLAQLRKDGVTDARLYGADGEVLGGLNAFYLIRGEPEVFGLPSNPIVPSTTVPRSTFWAVLTGLAVALGALFKFRDRTKDSPRLAGGAGPNPAAARGEHPA